MSMLEHVSDAQRDHWREALERSEDAVSSVGSESLEHKWHRYDKLLAEWELEPGVSVHDVGAGVGHLYEFIRARYAERGIKYSASEITEEFCEIAKANHSEIVVYNRDILSEDVHDRYDFVFLSGVFHQNGSTPHTEWVEYMQALLSRAWQITGRGMSFNVLSPFADYYAPGNFYVGLPEVETFVARCLSRYYVVDHASPLFEATFHVYRPEEMQRKYPEQSLARYMAADRQRDR